MLTNAGNLTALEPDETNVGSPIPATPRVFRHGFWQLRRAATYDALLLAGTETPVLERFETCGTNAWVSKCQEQPDRYRVESATCRNRWCEACAREKRLTVCRNIREIVDARRIRFVTLTIRSSNDPLRDQITRLVTSFKKLRQRKAMKSHFAGGVFFLEVTWNLSRERWHPHLHCLVEGGYIPHDQLSKEWHQVTGDSFIVHVKRLTDPNAAVNYVTKYSMKCVSPSVWRNRDRFAEAMLALKGTRVFNTFGTWRGYALTKNPDDDLTWEPITRLEDLLRRAQAGDPISHQILASLRYRRNGEPIRPPAAPP